MTAQVSQITLASVLMKVVTQTYPELTINRRQYNAVLNAANTLAEELNKPHVAASDNIGLEAWLATDDVGLSSKFLALKLSGAPEALEYAHPHDSVDFKRCCKMLKAIPELQSKLSNIAKESDVWAGLVEDWDTVNKLIDNDECTEAYALITKNH
jgi:hypothetical protein